MNSVIDLQSGLVASVTAWMQASFAIWGSIIVLPVVFLWGENGAIVAFALSAQGYINPVSAAIFAFLGSFLADLFWYVACASALRPCVLKRTKQDLKPEKPPSTLIGLARLHPYITLTILKFLMGVRLMLTIYILTSRKIPFRAYFICTAFGNLLFISVLFPLGWYLGKGLSHALALEKSITSIVTLMLVFGVGSQLVFYAVKRTISYMGSLR